MTHTHVGGIIDPYQPTSENDMQNAIQMTSHEGREYFTTVARGTEYTASKGTYGWEVYTRRLALGRFNVGGFKRFSSLADVSANVRAFAGLDMLVQA